MNGRRNFLMAPLVLVLAVLTGGWLVEQGVQEERNTRGRDRVVDQVMSLVRNAYVDPVNEADLYSSAIEGIMSELGDPNSSFLEASEYEDVSIRTEGEYGGVGLEIVDRDGYVTVMNPIPGGPGLRAGIRTGDRIVSVEGTSIIEAGSDAAADMLRGRPGTEVALEIERSGVETRIPFTIERALIEVKSVPFFTMLDEGIGYVPLQIFSEVSPREVRQAVDSLQIRGLRGLILDLRGNPGGVLDSGVGVTDLFLDRGAAIVETRGRAPGQDETYAATAREAFKDLPLVVLIDERSASASEIVAGALQDHDRALLLGRRSWGKGSVQSLYTLSSGDVLKLTTARWFTPVGRSIDKAADERVGVFENAALSLTGALIPRPPVEEERPTYTSDGGRTLEGGGGITPDLTVYADTLNPAEQEAVRSLYREAGTLNRVMFDHVVQYVADHPELDPEFPIGQAELDALRASLSSGEVEIDPANIRDASRYLMYQLESEIALQGLGVEGQFRRLMRHDEVLNKAAELLRTHQSQQKLLEVAASEEAGAQSRMGAP